MCGARRPAHSSVRSVICERRLTPQALNALVVPLLFDVMVRSPARHTPALVGARIDVVIRISRAAHAHLRPENVTAGSSTRARLTSR